MRTLLLVLLSFSAQAAVTMLVPGFTLKELPVEISNINNLRFAPDGSLTALGYNGKIYQLRDTNGDGLEDSMSTFWDKPTLSVPVGMVWSTNGLYVSSHGKVSLLRDTNGDGKADEEQIIATGWPATDVGSGGVDATSVTTDAHGNLYFGLLVADYSNPYRIKNGVSRYDLNSPRGTIQKWNAATKTLESIATGIRVPYNLAFNRHGDLFVSDQEGETWCPDGNPLDEINHIIPGRNYGFPPRHPQWLPNLISEPPVVSFGPQHQSVCGFVFNEPRPNQKLFGPAWWEGDAIVAGESRGKIWRARMVKTPTGYVGREFLIARLDMLTTDVQISPRGDLYVSCHSGEPDWGTGPNGPGKIYKISYTNPFAPQPVAVWPANSMEVVVDFDKPINPAITNQVGDMAIEFGDYVSAADRLEKLKPPYKVVSYQESTPRGKLRVLSAEVSGKRLRLKTDPHSQATRFALKLPNIDLAYSLNGVEATVGGNSEWLPHLDPNLSHGFGFSSLFSKDGQIVLKTRLNLPGKNPKLHLDGDTRKVTTDVITQTLKTPITKPSKIAYSTDDDPTQRPIPLDAFLLPWAPLPRPVLRMPETDLKLVGGDYESGREMFFGEKLKCSTCHSIRGEGAKIAADLSNLSHRDPAAVLRDIREPSAAINPDYVAYNVALKNGDEPTGFVRAQSAEQLRLITIDGKERTIPQHEITSMRPSNVSLMPEGLLNDVPEKEIRHLLTFLCSAPPVRTTNDISAFLSPMASQTHGRSVVLVASKQDHGPGQHDYPAWQKDWSAKFNATTAWEWPAPEQWKTADVMVFYFWNHDWSEARYAEMDAFQKRGGGMVFLHAACIADKEPEKLAQRIGLAAQPGPTKYLHTPFNLKFVAPTNHPIALKQIELPFLDEPYWPMIGDTNRVQTLAVAEIEGKSEPLIWTCERNGGRVFVSIPGHYTWTLNDPVFEALIRRAIEWAAPSRSKEPQ